MVPFRSSRNGTVQTSDMCPHAVEDPKLKVSHRCKLTGMSCVNPSWPKFERCLFARGQSTL